MTGVSNLRIIFYLGPIHISKEVFFNLAVPILMLYYIQIKTINVDRLLIFIYYNSYIYTFFRRMKFYFSRFHKRGAKDEKI